MKIGSSGGVPAQSPSIFLGKGERGEGEVEGGGPTHLDDVEERREPRKRDYLI